MKSQKDIHRSSSESSSPSRRGHRGSYSRSSSNSSSSSGSSYSSSKSSSSIPPSVSSSSAHSHKRSLLKKHQNLSRSSKKRSPSKNNKDKYDHKLDRNRSPRRDVNRSPNNKSRNLNFQHYNSKDSIHKSPVGKTIRSVSPHEPYHTRPKPRANSNYIKRVTPTRTHGRKIATYDSKQISRDSHSPRKRKFSDFKPPRTYNRRPISPSPYHNRYRHTRKDYKYTKSSNRSPSNKRLKKRKASDEKIEYKLEKRPSETKYTKTKAAIGPSHSQRITDEKLKDKNSARDLILQTKNESKFNNIHEPINHTDFKSAKSDKITFSMEASKLENNNSLDSLSMGIELKDEKVALVHHSVNEIDTAEGDTIFKSTIFNETPETKSTTSLNFEKTNTYIPKIEIGISQETTELTKSLLASENRNDFINDDNNPKAITDENEFEDNKTPITESIVNTLDNMSPENRNNFSTNFTNSQVTEKLNELTVDNLKSALDNTNSANFNEDQSDHISVNYSDDDDAHFHQPSTSQNIQLELSTASKKKQIKAIDHEFQAPENNISNKVHHPHSQRDPSFNNLPLRRNSNTDWPLSHQKKDRKTSPRDYKSRQSEVYEKTEHKYKNKIIRGPSSYSHKESRVEARVPLRGGTRVRENNRPKFGKGSKYPSFENEWKHDMFEQLLKEPGKQKKQIYLWQSEKLQPIESEHS